MITKLMIAIVVILFIMGTGCLILDQQDKNRKLEKQNKELQTTVDLLKAGQEAMQNDQKQYARLYHDYKNHAICMQRLIEQKKYKDLEVYLKGMQENYFYGKTEEVPATGNAILDAVLSVKFSRCKELGIRTFSMIEGDFSHMDNFHVIILLLNILDNAIEASCREENEKRINLVVRKKEEYVSIFVENKITASVLDTNPNLKTTKEESRKHGIGMEEIRDIIKAVDGLMEVYEKNGFFCLLVLLPAEIS